MKNVLIGFTPDHGGHEALALGRLLANQVQVTLTVCVVVPERWDFPAIGRVDAEYVRFVHEHAEQALTQARSLLAGVPDVHYLKQPAASATEGLTQAAAEVGADVILVGSARHGAVGRLVMGGVTEEIMHLSGLPVLMAPRDYTFPKGSRVPRVTVAYSGGGSDTSGTLQSALGVARSLGVPLRLMSFAVRDRNLFPAARMGPDTDIADAWQEHAEKALAQACERLQGMMSDDVVAPVALETAISRGLTWDDALGEADWQVGELLAVGSSRMGLLRHVFLSSNGAKILRASPVPVLVLPRA